MNTVWSEHIQGVKTLYLSRKLRFDDLFKEQYMKLFGLDPEKKLKILEIGCGPGAVAAALKKWYPKAEVTGLDRDSRFISFASENFPEVSFIEGDATALPFEDGAFDVTISYTLQEHVEPDAFWGEQMRVLKPGGVCICLSARKGISRTAACLGETLEEEAFWLRQPDDDTFEKYHVGKYAVTEMELPALMEEHGFSKVSAGYVIIDLTPDDPKYPREFVEAMIEADRQGDLEAIDSAHDPKSEEVRAAVNAKYDERLKLLRAGVKQWDTSVNITMILRGVK